MIRFCPKCKLNLRNYCRLDLPQKFGVICMFCRVDLTEEEHAYSCPMAIQARKEEANVTASNYPLAVLTAPAEE